jgi:hypothetical protein
MVKSPHEARPLLSPGLKEAPVLDRMCSQFVLSLTLRHAARFNLRRDWNSLLSLTGKHLVWPTSVLARLRSFLAMRCKGNEHWSGHESLSDEAFMARHGGWRGPYEEGTLFFYIDEYIKDAPKDLIAVIGSTADWLARSLKKESTLVEKNIDALAGLLQLNPAERHAGALSARSARPAGGVQGRQRAGSLCRDRRRGRCQRDRRRRSAARRLAARTHRHGREPDLGTQHHRLGRSDESQ